MPEKFYEILNSCVRTGPLRATHDHMTGEHSVSGYVFVCDVRAIKDGLLVLVGAVETNRNSNSNASLVSGAAAESMDSEAADLEQLVRRYGPRVQRFCIAMTGDQDEALDLAQDVFVVAIERQTSFRGSSSVETWLLGIAVRVCRNWNRRRAIRRRVFGLFASSKVEVAGDTSLSVDQRDEIALGLRAMDVRDREVLVLRYFEGREIEEIAEIVKLSRAGVDQRLSRARRKLADWLEGR